MLYSLLVHHLADPFRRPDRTEDPKHVFDSLMTPFLPSPHSGLDKLRRHLVDICTLTTVVDVLIQCSADQVASGYQDACGLSRDERGRSNGAKAIEDLDISAMQLNVHRDARDVYLGSARIVLLQARRYCS